jgi:hypothetical protein
MEEVHSRSVLGIWALSVPSHVCKQRLMRCRIVLFGMFAKKLKFNADDSRQMYHKVQYLRKDFCPNAAQTHNHPSTLKFGAALASKATAISI